MLSCIQWRQTLLNKDDYCYLLSRAVRDRGPLITTWKFAFHTDKTDDHGRSGRKNRHNLKSEVFLISWSMRIWVVLILTLVLWKTRWRSPMKTSFLRQETPWQPRIQTGRVRKLISRLLYKLLVEEGGERIQCGLSLQNWVAIMAKHDVHKSIKRPVEEYQHL